MTSPRTGGADVANEVTCPQCGTVWVLDADEAQRSEYACEECGFAVPLVGDSAAEPQSLPRPVVTTRSTKAGYCKVCGQNVWLNADGGCSNGHPPNCVVGVYDPSTPPPPLSTVENVANNTEPQGDIITAVIGTFGAVMAILILGAATGSEWIGFVAVIAVAAWVFNDVRDMGDVAATGSPSGWGWGVALLLIVFLPMYLYKRPILRWKSAQGRA